MRREIYGEIEISLPEDWLGNSTVLLAGPPRNAFAPNISVTRQFLVTPTTLHAYADVQKVSLEKLFADKQYLVLEEGEIALGQLSAYQRFHRFFSEGGVWFVQWQVYLLKGVHAITLTATDHLETFETCFPTFREIVLTCNWVEY